MLKDLTNPITSSETIPLPSKYSIKVLNTAVESNPTLLQDIGRLRYQVWQQQGMDMSNTPQKRTIIDAIDENAIIWAIYYEQKIIATARLNVYLDLSLSPTAYMHQQFTAQFKPPVATFTRLVVHQQHQGLKLGKWLDQIRLQQAKILGVKSVLLLCPPHRVSSLQKIGFEWLGEGKPSKLWPDAKWMIMKYEL